jgi:hypothetical protein
MSDRHLLVDAYNVIHAWPELRALLAAHGPEAAQARLADLLRPIHDAEGWRVSLVFDGRGDAVVVERPGTELTFSHIFSPRGLSADGVIEQLVTNATLPPAEDSRKPAPAGKARRVKSGATTSTSPRKGAEIVVATGDHLLGEATAAAGARLLSPDGLRDWAEHAAAEQTRALAARTRRTHSEWKSRGSSWDQLPSRPRS